MQVLSRKYSAPRHITAAEGAPLLRMLNTIFVRGVPTGMETEYPHLYGDMTANREWTHVITHRGEIVSHVGVYPLLFVSPAGRMLVGGIGAVATQPAFRGQGLMAALLEHATAWMRNHGMPASILWGDQTRYARFGWVGAGARITMGVTRRSAETLGRWTLPVSRITDPGPVMEELHALHRTLPVRVERSASVFPCILRKVGRQVYAARQGRRIAAYVLARRWVSRRHVSFHVEEAAGSAAGILGIFRWLASRPGVDRVEAEAPVVHQPHLTALLGGADGWSTSIVHLGQVKIVDLAGIAAAYHRPALASTVLRHRIAPSAQPPLLFGPLAPAVALGPRAAQATGFRGLPLPFYLCRSDHV